MSVIKLTLPAEIQVHYAQPTKTPHTTANFGTKGCNSVGLLVITKGCTGTRNSRFMLELENIKFSKEISGD